ncbi:hypothetical protein BRC2024_KWYBBTRE_CDS_0100 [Acinetobacter phage vB_AbaM_AB-Navy-v2]
MTEEFNIETVKRHIKNLIAGNGINKDDMLQLYREVLKEQVESRVHKLFAAYNLERFIEKQVNAIIQQYLNGIINKYDGWLTTKRSIIEDMVLSECRKQVEEQIREHFKVTLKGVEQFGDSK